MTVNDVFQKKILVFLEHPDDVSIYLAKKQDISGDHLLIATIPEVAWELEKKGVCFIGIESFYDPTTIYSKGIENYSVVETLCSSIDAVFHEKDPFLKKYDFRPARDNFYFLKMLFDNLTLRMLLIRSVIAREKPDQIIIFSNGDEYTSPDSLNFPFAYNDRLYSLLLKKGVWNIDHIEIKNIQKINQVEQKSKNNQSLTVHISKILKQYPLFFIPLLTLKKCGFFQAIKVFCFQVINPVAYDKTLFLLRDDPSWAEMIPQLYRSKYHVKYLPEKNERINTGPALEKNLLDEIHVILKLKGIFLQVDLSEIIEARFFPVLSEYNCNLPQIVQDLEKKIFSYHPAAFLSSEKTSYIEHIYAHVARYHNIPVIAWQHGDGPFYPPMQVYVEIMDSDIHLSYGPGHQAMLQNAPHNHFDCRIESTGSLILEKKFLNPPKPRNQTRILYVTTAFYYNNLYVNCYPVPDNTVWSHQKMILNAFANISIPVDFKLFPDPSGTHFIEDYCRTRNPENISIIRTGTTFLELLDTARIVVCDYPSTPVIEAIAAHKTVFVLLDSPNLRKEALDLLKKRVYWSEDVSTFIEMITDFLNDKPLEQHPDINNTEYLERFGLHKLDGKVADRALAIIDRETHSLCK